MHRFFVPPEIFKHEPVILAGWQAHQMRNVLRLRPGARVLLLDNSGLVYEAEVAGYREREVAFNLVDRRVAAGDPAVRLTLYQAVLKGEHFNWALQKGTEIGVSRFVPLICRRSVVEDRQAIEQKRARWERIIQEAAEQSGRARLPELAPSQSLADALREGQEAAALDPLLLRLIPWEEEHGQGLREALAACNLCPGSRIQVFVGPEGGFAEDEVNLARQCGVRPVSLGARILRAETAGLVAAAAILYHSGDMDPHQAG